MSTVPTFNELLERMLGNCTDYVNGALRTFIDTLAVVAPRNPLYTLNVKNAQIIENGKTHDGYVIVVTDIPVNDPNNTQEILDSAIMKRLSLSTNRDVLLLSLSTMNQRLHSTVGLLINQYLT